MAVRPTFRKARNLRSTFIFNTAGEGKAFFELGCGPREKRGEEEIGLVYSRINNPNLGDLDQALPRDWPPGVLPRFHGRHTHQG
jgi:hypothetical protein